MQIDRPGRHRRERPQRWVIPVSLLFVLGVASAGVALDRRESTAGSVEPSPPGGATGSTQDAEVAEQPDAPSTRPGSEAPGGNASTDLDVAVTKPPVVVPRTGTGTFSVTARREPGHQPSDVELTYTVEIEQGLPFGRDRTASAIERILEDPRGWLGVDGQQFHRVESSAEVRIVVASPSTTDELCAPLETAGRVSCRNGELVVLNARRWAFGIEDYRGRLDDYRAYVVNHEVGHALGRSHVECPGSGRPAPVMMQQTYGLDGCRRNPWPTVS